MVSVEGEISFGFQGEKGAFSEIAGERFFSAHGADSCKPVGFRTFSDVCAAVKGGEVKYGLLPAESSFSGSIPAVYEAILRSEVHVVSETSDIDDLSFLALPGVKIEDIKRVISQAEVFPACSRFLATLKEKNGRFIEQSVCWDTAGSCALLESGQYKDTAVIASKHAGRSHSLEVLEEEVGNLESQSTRYFIISSAASRPGDLSSSGKVKVSLAVALQNRPGTLMKVIAAFSFADFNITKLESRPAATIGDMFDTTVNIFEYVYFIDVEILDRFDDFDKTIEYAKKLCVWVKEMGRFPVTTRTQPASPTHPWTLFM